MKRRLVVRSAAEWDIQQAALWYEARVPGLGMELLQELGAAMERAVEAPQQFPLLLLRPEVRRILTKRFPYRVFFICRRDAVVVFAVLHAAQRDQVWTSRI